MWLTPPPSEHVGVQIATSETGTLLRKLSSKHWPIDWFDCDVWSGWFVAIHRRRVGALVWNLNVCWVLMDYSKCEESIWLSLIKSTHHWRHKRILHLPPPSSPSNFLIHPISKRIPRESQENPPLELRGRQTPVPIRWDSVRRASNNPITEQWRILRILEEAHQEAVKVEGGGARGPAPDVWELADWCGMSLTSHWRQCGVNAHSLLLPYKTLECIHRDAMDAYQLPRPLPDSFAILPDSFGDSFYFIL